MTSRDFAYWLQGFFELSDATTLNEKQTELVKAHLNLVFIHEIDPSFPKEQQKALNEEHSRPRRSFGGGRDDLPPGVEGDVLMMTGYDFVQWFEGVLDMNPDGLSREQVEKVREKMKTVRSPAEFAAMQAADPKGPQKRC